MRRYLTARVNASQAYPMIPAETATPHNVQLDTPQAESCNACHGNAEWFLTADRVKPAELRANQSVILGSVPAPVPLEEETAP
jgi:hypothetical protein